MKHTQIAQQVETARTLLGQFKVPRVAQLLQSTYDISQRSAYRRIADAQNGAEIVANPSKEKGTKTETAVVRTAVTAGFPDAERLALAGAFDMGDVRLCRGVIVEVKGGKAAEQASTQLIEDWLAETEKERVRAGAEFGLLVTKRAGKGYDNAHAWYAWMQFADFARLAAKAYDRPLPIGREQSNEFISASLTVAPVQMTLGDFLALFRHAGYPASERHTALHAVR